MVVCKFLAVWQEARMLVKMIYQVSTGFPSEEKFGLVAQISSAAISVSSNIAEGAGRKNIKEQKHFYNIAYASSMEVLSQLILSVDLEFVDPINLDNDFRPIIETISLKLFKLKQ